MKRKICILITVLLLLALVSCKNNGSDELIKKYMDEVYHEYHPTYDAGLTEEELIKSKIIKPKAVIRSVESNMEKNIEKQISGVKYRLMYKNTETYPESGEVLYTYAIDGDEDKKVKLDKDGSIKQFIGSLISVNLDKNETQENVKILIEPILLEYVDISKYSHCEIKHYPNESDGFGKYHFTYYNSIGGYRTGTTQIEVEDDGKITRLNIGNYGAYSQNCTINKWLEHILLDLKMKELYSEFYGPSVTYSRVENIEPRINVKNGELMVEYTLATHYRIDGMEVSAGILNRKIYIPLRLISNYTDNSSGTNNSDTGDTDTDANKRLESLLEQLYKGQPYEEVCEILGGPGVNTASGMIRYEWIVDSSIKVIVYFNKIIYPNNYQLVVESFRGEIIE